MSEMKEYVSRIEEMGSVHISEDVVSSIAAVSAVEVEGVSSLAANLGSDIAGLLSTKKNLAKGVRLQMEEEGVVVDMAVLVKYGYAIQDVAKAIQDAVISGVEAMTGLHVAAVNVNVAGMAFGKLDR